MLREPATVSILLLRRLDDRVLRVDCVQVATLRDSRSRFDKRQGRLQSGCLGSRAKCAGSVKVHASTSSNGACVQVMGPPGVELRREARFRRWSSVEELISSSVSGMIPVCWTLPLCSPTAAAADATPGDYLYWGLSAMLNQIKNQSSTLKQGLGGGGVGGGSVFRTLQQCVWMWLHV